MEWVGLTLLVAVVLGALLAFGPRVEGRALGAAVLSRIVCAAGGACGGEALAAPAQRSGARAAVVPVPRLRHPPRASDRERLRRAGQRLKALGKTALKRAWIACIGWRRFRYERRHPERLDPLAPIPVRDGLQIANDCMNPAGFLGRP